MEAAIVNTLSPGERVLAISVGNFGDRFARIEVPAERLEDAVRFVHHELFEMEAKP